MSKSRCFMKPGKHEGIVELRECFIRDISSEHISSPLSACLCCASWQPHHRALQPCLCSSPKAIHCQAGGPSLTHPAKTYRQQGRASAGHVEPGREGSVWQGYGPLTEELGQQVCHRGCLPAGWLLPSPVMWRQHVFHCT